MHPVFVLREERETAGADCRGRDNYGGHDYRSTGARTGEVPSMAAFSPRERGGLRSVGNQVIDVCNPATHRYASNDTLGRNYSLFV